jgi:hypothetical protein
VRAHRRRLGEAWRAGAMLAIPLAAALAPPAAARSGDDDPGSTAFVGSYHALESAQDVELAAPPAEKGGWKFELAGFYEAVELDSITAHYDDYYGNTGAKAFEWDDVERERWGARFLAGFGSLRFGFEYFSEQFDADDRFKGDGGAFILNSESVVTGGRDYQGFIDFGLRFGYVRDNGDVLLRDSFGNLVAGHASLDYEYGELDLGGGVRIGGFEAAVGMRVDDLYGQLDVDRGRHYYLFGPNFAFYTRVGFQPAGLPVFADATLLLGEIRGFSVAAGFRF